MANEKNDELCDKVFGNISLSPRDRRKYYKNNADRIEAADAKGTSPYFIRDNKDTVDNIIREKKKRKSPLQIAEERHAARTPEYIASVQQRWNDRQLSNLESEINNGNLPSDVRSKIDALKASNTPDNFDNIKSQIAFYQQRAKQHMNRGIDKVKDIVAQWKERIDSRTIAKLIDDSVVPEMDYRAEMPKRATLKDKLDNAIRGGIYYQGESGAIARGFSSCLGQTYDKSTTQAI